MNKLFDRPSKTQFRTKSTCDGFLPASHPPPSRAHSRVQHTTHSYLYISRAEQTTPVRQGARRLTGAVNAFTDATIDRLLVPY